MVSAYLQGVCRIQQLECCRYITMGAKGFECAKLTSLKPVIDARVDQMNAQGDNCRGSLNLNADEPQEVPNDVRV